VSAAPLDSVALRADFPALQQEIHGKPLVYLDNAATTHKPRAVLDALDQFHRRDNSNVHRGVHTLSQRATDSYEGARARIAQFLSVETDEIVFVRGATEGINLLVANAFLRPRLQPGDEVLITAMEHHANIVPWQLACDATGAQLRVAPMSQAGELLLDELEPLLTDRTKLLALTHVSNALGTVNPVAQIAEMAHAHGVPVLVDGAQAVQHLPVDVAQLGVDFYALSGHKLYGPTGIGVLWARAEHLEAMPPWQGGGDMIRSVTFEKTEFAPPPRFEAGTPHIAGAIGLGAAVEYLTEIGLKAIAAHERELLAAATDAVAAIDGVRLIGTAAKKASVLSFVVEGVHPHDIGTVLDRNGVAVRTGHHCAQPVMAFYGVPATVRASFGLYNYRAEIEPLCTALREAQELFA